MFKYDSGKKAARPLEVLMIVFGLSLLPVLVATVVQGGATEPQRATSQKKKTKARTTEKPRIDYSRFSHGTHVTTQKLACDSCHKFPTKNWKDVRKGDAAFPDVTEFPEHSSCLNCHRQQFFARERPAPAICSNCHVKVTPRETARFLFPSLGDVSDSSKRRRDVDPEFVINFPHDKHVDVVGLNAPTLRPASRAAFVTVTWQQKDEPKDSEPPNQLKSCPVCHQTLQPQGNSDEEFVTKPPKNLGDAFWLKKGTFKTIPNSHAVCFTCHNTDVGIEPLQSNCNTCHKLVAPPIRGPQTGSPLGVEAALKTDFDQNLAQTMGLTDRTILTVWHRRMSSGTFRHEGGEHPNLSCAGCHDVPKMNTTDMKTQIVPTRSCGGAEGCHITATIDEGGILNYEIDQKKANPNFVCTKCHISFGKEAVPENHLKAIPTPTPKVTPLQ
jgi:hypothetical protein